MAKIKLEPYEKIEFNSETHKGLRFTRDNYGIGNAFYKDPSTNEEVHIGKVDIVSGHFWVNNERKQFDKYDSPDNLFAAFCDLMDNYVDKEMVNITMDSDRYTIQDIAADIEQFMFERGEYSRNEKDRPLQIDYSIPQTDIPSDEYRQKVIINIERDCTSVIGKISLTKYLDDEIASMDEDDESINLAEKALSALCHNEIETLYTPYGTNSDVDRLVNSDNWVDRSNAAKRGYALDRLMFDSDYKVRADVANTGFRLDEFLYDDNEYVQELAREKFIRDIGKETVPFGDNTQISIVVEEEDKNKYYAKEVSVTIYDNDDNEIATAYSIPIEKFAQFLHNLKETHGDKDLIKQLDYVRDVSDRIYEVTGYLSSSYSGVTDVKNFNDWSKVEEYAHERLMNGDYVEIINNLTGKSIRIDPDTYSQIFDGEFPYKSSDFERYETSSNKSSTGKECPKYNTERD